MEAREKIKKHISELGMTQTELAKLCGLTFATINRVLNGKQELKQNTLAKIADALDIPVNDLIEEDRDWSYNYAVQGYLQFGDEIKHITSFKQLKDWIKKHEPLINELPNKAKAIKREDGKNARNIAKNTEPIDRMCIDFYRNETIDASKVATWSFRKTEDERDGFDIDLGNMGKSFHFDVNGIVFTNSEALYICGLFSNNTTKHRTIQEKLLSAKCGYDAKKKVRTKYEDLNGRKDWESFNVEYMKWCVWQKIKGNEDFRNTLLSVPQNAIIIENATHHSGSKAAFWGMRNKELEANRDDLEKCTKYDYPTLNKKDLAVKIMEARNSINHLGTWEGTNCMGKILKYLQLCLIDGEEPKIDYDLLRSKQIYLFGELLKFE